MKKAINILLRISKVLDIINIAFAGVIFIFGIVSIIPAVKTGSEVINAGSGAAEESVILFVTALVLAITFITLGIILAAGSIANLIVVNKSQIKLQSCFSRRDIRGLAIANIITGCLSVTTSIVAGILMLVNKDYQLQ